MDAGQIVEENTPAEFSETHNLKIKTILEQILDHNKRKNMSFLMFCI